MSDLEAAPDLDVASVPADAPESPWWRWLLGALVGFSLLGGLVLRFVTTSPLWLDEALSVNIARLPLVDIGDALRRDGHPPLYYWLLHGWMDLFGTGSVAVRAFSGLWALTLFPLMWVAGRRLGGRRVAVYAVTLLALSPYAIRYGTETRMYVMVSVLSLAAWLVIDDARTRPTIGRMLALAALTGALLWTHYWAMWLLGAAGMLVLTAWWRARGAEADAQARAWLRVLGALVVGSLTFLPWVPNLLYQGAHTGTPWARPLRPAEMLANTVADFGGGALAENLVLGWFLVLLVLTGLFGRGVDRHTVAVDLRTRPDARVLALVIVLTSGIAVVAGYATGATYASRYAAVFFPFFILLGALGLSRFQGRPLVVGALAVVVVFGTFGGVRNVVVDRSDAGANAEVIEAVGQTGDWVIYCPDQLGPATARVLGEGFEQATYPSFDAPERVDWVDYNDKLAAASPDRFADDLVERAQGRTIFLVYSTTYITHTETCPALFNAIANRGRVAETLRQPSEAYESSAVVAFRVPAS